MKLKELYKEYPKYDIVVFGKPLSQKTIPFTFLPKDKDLKECEVMEIEKIDKEFIQYGVKFSTLKPIKPKKMKGTIYVYVR